MLTPLRHPVFRNLFLAQVLTLIGTGFTTIGLALLAHDIAGSDAGLILGTALALKMIAYVGLAPLAGAYAHLLPRRFTLTALSVCRAALVCVLPFVTQAVEIYAVIFFLNAFAAAYTPLFQATIPDILPDEREYTQALSLSRLAYDLENLFSPSLAAVALAFVSYNALFAFNGALFVAAAVLIVVSGIAAVPAPARDVVAVDRLFGLRAYLRTPRLRALLALSFAVASASAMVIVNTVVYVEGRLGASESEVAVAMAFAGGGSMITALLLPRLLEYTKDRMVLLIGGVLLACGLFAGSAAPGLYGVYAIWFVLGVGWSLIQTPAGRLIQQSCLPEDRPAYFAAHFSLTHVCWLVLYPLVGILGARFSLDAAFLATGGIAAVALLAGFVLGRDERVEISHTHAGLRHTHRHVHDEHHAHVHMGGADPAHSHAHSRTAIVHRHRFTIDRHHPVWPD